VLGCVCRRSTWKKDDVLKLKNLAYLHVLLILFVVDLIIFMSRNEVLRMVGMVAVEASSFLLTVAFPTIHLWYMQTSPNCLSLGKIITPNILGN
jgi:positive regulator of sigma E activity